MRTWRLPLAGTALAQEDPPDPMAPAVVTGTVMGGPQSASGTGTAEDGAYRTEGIQFRNTWSATAYVVMDWTTMPAVFTGAIFPGEMPAFPEVPAE